jgi:hypothetical protein
MEITNGVSVLTIEHCMLKFSFKSLIYRPVSGLKHYTNKTLFSEAMALHILNFPTYVF